MWEKIKQHPWIIGGVVGLLLLVLVFSSGSSSSTATTATGSTTDTNGDALTSYLAGLNLQGQQVAAAAGVQNQQTAAAVTVAQLQAGTTDNANTLAAQVAEFETQIAGNVQMNHDTTTLQATENTNATQLGIAQSNNSALVQEATVNAATTTHLVDALTSVYNNQITAQVQQTAIGANESETISSQNSGLFGGGGFLGLGI